jgi:hypothetical protein
MEVCGTQRWTLIICLWDNWYKQKDMQSEPWGSVKKQTPKKQKKLSFFSLLETRCEGEGDRCDSFWMTLEGSLVRCNLHPWQPVESVDDEHEPPCVRQLDSLIWCGQEVVMWQIRADFFFHINLFLKVQVRVRRTKGKSGTEAGQDTKESKRASITSKCSLCSAVSSEREWGPNLIWLFHTNFFYYLNSIITHVSLPLCPKATPHLSLSGKMPQDHSNNNEEKKQK